MRLFNDMHRSNRPWPSRVLFAFGFLLLAYWAFATWSTHARNAAQEERFAEMLAEASEQAHGDHAEQAPAPPRQLSEGDIVGRIEIPRVGVSTVILHGIEEKTLDQAAGHFPGTALPEEPAGNFALAGHRDTFFKGLKDIADGDEITVSTLAGDLTYRVAWTKVVGPKAVEVLDPTTDPTLTLVTCYPFNYYGAAPQRFIVRAERVGADEGVVAASSRATSSAARRSTLPRCTGPSCTLDHEHEHEKEGNR